MKSTTRHSLLASLLAFLAVAPPTRAQYTFTLIAESSSPTFDTFTWPSINAAGTVAFIANLDASAGGGDGIFTGAGAETTSIALSNEPIFGSLTTWPSLSINAAGTVAFKAARDAGAGGGVGIFAGTGAAISTIALTTGPIFRDFGTNASINTAGAVAFMGYLDTGGTGIFTMDGGAMTEIALSTDPTFGSFGSGVSLNSAGTVGFVAVRDPGAGGGFGIFTGAGGATTDIALSIESTFDGLGGPVINAAGTTAFLAQLVESAGGGVGIFTGAGGATTAIALSTGPIFSDFGPLGTSISINTEGMVAFWANLDAGGSGIYLGDGGTTTRVIGTGDALFGSTVSDLGFGSGGLNDLGQVAFRYHLADGRTGVAVATVPEPTAVLLMMGSIGLFASRRNAKRRHGGE